MSVKSESLAKPLLCSGLIVVVGALFRLIEWPAWAAEELWIAGEPLLPSADVYAWLAGAAGDGRMAGWPMARLIEWFSILSGQSYSLVAFWLPCLLAGIPGAMVAWLCWQRGFALSGLAGGVFATGALGYLARTRLGYGDTDLFALAATTAFSVVWALAMEALVRCRAQERGLGMHESGWLAGGFATAWAGLVVYPSGYPVLLAIALAGIAWVLMANRRRGVTEASVAGVGMLWALHFGWFGLMLAALLAWLMVWRPQYRTVAGLVLLGGVTIVVIVVFQADYLSGVVQRVSAYLGRGVPPAAISDWQLPRVDDSIQETVRPSWGEWVQRVGTHWVFLLGGLSGFVMALMRWPALVTFLPLLGLGLGSYWLGNRFAMYAAPALGLGLGLGLALLLTRMQVRSWIRAAAHVGLTILVTGVIGWHALEPEPAPMLVKDHAQALAQLAEFEHDRGRVWTWWDAGYSAQYFSRLPTLADGGNASRQRIFMLGQVFGANEPERAAAFMRFAGSERYRTMAEEDDWRKASYGARPLDSLTDQPSKKVQTFLDGLAKSDHRTVGPSADEFLVVSWRTLMQSQWIDYYGRWRLTDGEQGHGRIARIQPPVELDEASGMLHTADAVVPLASIDIVAAGEHFQREWRNPAGAHAVINNDRGEGILMDSDLHGMLAVQMLLGEPVRFSDQFELITDRFPEARIYRLRQ